MLFNWLKRTPKLPELDLSVLRVDLHSHLIPGIDDGAQTIQDSIQLIHQLVDIGIKKIITTPHIMADYYRNTPEIIDAGLEKLREELEKIHLKVEIEAGAEYYLDELFEEKLNSERLMTIGKDHLLFELSFVNQPKSLFDTIERIKDKGLTPILAHPERYPYFFDSMENYSKVKDAGCNLQLNTISLTGYFGKQSQKVAEQLLEKKLIDFVASDMHHMRHADALKKTVKLPLMQDLLHHYTFKNNTL